MITFEEVFYANFENVRPRGFTGTKKQILDEYFRLGYDNFWEKYYGYLAEDIELQINELRKNPNYIFKLSYQRDSDFYNYYAEKFRKKYIEKEKRKTCIKKFNYKLWNKIIDNEISKNEYLKDPMQYIKYDSSTRNIFYGTFNQPILMENMLYDSKDITKI